jgi:hypothetical protein
MADSKATPGGTPAPRRSRAAAKAAAPGTINIPVTVDTDPVHVRFAVHAVATGQPVDTAHQPAPAATLAAAQPVHKNEMPLGMRLLLTGLAGVIVLTILWLLFSGSGGNTKSSGATSGQSEAAALAAENRRLADELSKAGGAKPGACTQATVPNVYVENNSQCNAPTPAAPPIAPSTKKSEKKGPAVDKPAARPSTPAASGTAFIPDGGCVLTSNEDGAVLKSKPSVKLANGTEIAKASNQELVNDKTSLVVGLRAKHPTWLSEKAAHAGFCYDWRKAMSADLVVSPGKLN